MNNFTQRFPNFKSPYELIVFYDEQLLNEKYRLYPWQIEILEQFSDSVPVDDMIRMCVLAANGSGKSQFILAPCILWMCVSFDNSLSYVTSSSASQLDTQTERFIDHMADKMNVEHKVDTGDSDIWKIIKRHKEFLVTESHIDLFATDEPKKAEGKHPLVPGGEFGVFLDEGKSIDEDIYDAIDRCTGATRRLDVSSAGGCTGHLYNICTNTELNWWIKKITAWDCPHIKKKEIEQAILKHGLHDPLVRSMFFSEFTSILDKVVILKETLEMCSKIVGDNKVLFGPHAGLDLSAGGDEYVFSVWNGTVQVGQETGVNRDTSIEVRDIIDWMGKYKSYGLQDIHVNADDGGVGRAVLDNLREKGYNFNRILNQQRAFDSKRYANRGTELYWNFKLLVENNIVQLFNERILNSQLSNRYYRHQSLTNRIILESKEEARKKGHPSPDRADACVLAWANVDIESLINGRMNVEKKPVTPRYTLNELENIFFEDSYNLGEVSLFRKTRTRDGVVNHSVDSLMKSRGVSMKSL